MTFIKKFHEQKGFTFVETVVGSAVFLLVSLSVYQAFTVLMNVTLISSAKVAATELANEQVEIIRNLPYSDVGIIAGLPAGKIPRNQTIARNNHTFNVNTTIRSVDDPADGTIGGTPADTSPSDYKLVDLNITCSDCKNFTTTGFTTLVAPRALETASTNGALFIRIYDANGIPVSSASLHVTNTQTNPDTIIDETTDNDGWLKIVDAPPGTNAYNIIASKPGYSQEQTYLSGGAAGATPVNTDVTVVQQQVSQASLSIDKVGSLNVSTTDVSCAALPNIGFSLTGTKLIGTPDVLKYATHTFATDATGNHLVPNLEWDTYKVLLTSASYDLAGVSLLPSFALNPDENKDLQLIVVPHINSALLVSVEDSTNTAIDGATVRLQKNGFDQTKVTSSGACPAPGQVFWNGLASDTYTLTVSKDGYQSYTNNAFNISTNWENQDIILTP